MTPYALRRLLLMLPTLLLGTLIVFTLLRVLPGDEATLIVGDRAVSAEQRADLEQRLGLDRPLAARYVTFLGDLLRGDLGESSLDGRPVRTGAARLSRPVAARRRLGGLAGGRLRSGAGIVTMEDGVTNPTKG